LAELSSQSAQTRIGLAFEPLQGLAVALEGGAHAGHMAWGQSQQGGFALLAVGQGGGGMGFAAGAAAVGFAAFAAQTNEGSS
jgi:hypothetical protein